MQPTNYPNWVPRTDAAASACLGGLLGFRAVSDLSEGQYEALITTVVLIALCIHRKMGKAAIQGAIAGGQIGFAYALSNGYQNDRQSSCIEWVEQLNREMPLNFQQSKIEEVCKTGKIQISAKMDIVQGDHVETHPIEINENFNRDFSSIEKSVIYILPILLVKQIQYIFHIIWNAR